MKKLVVLLAAALALAGCIGKEANAVHMTISELMQDSEKYVDNETLFYHYGYKSLKPGDILVIEENISSKQSSENFTFLSFASDPSVGMYFGANLTDFNVGDRVKMTFHVVEDTFEKISGMQKWTYDLEVFEEGWDFQQHAPIPFPSSVIEHV